MLLYKKLVCITSSIVCNALAVMQKIGDTFMNGKASVTPDVVVKRCWQKLPAYIRWTFVAAVIMGFVAHLFVFTNDLINHDDIYHLFQCVYGAQSGRWFLPTVLQWDGSYSLPWLIGVLSILCLAVTACFTVNLLRIRGRLGILVTVTLLVAYPTVAATFSYMFIWALLGSVCSLCSGENAADGCTAWRGGSRFIAGHLSKLFSCGSRSYGGNAAF